MAGAEEGVYVIGVDKDEWVTSFGSGETEGSEFIISSAIKRVDQGVYDMVAMLAEGVMEGFPGGGIHMMDAAMNGVGLAPPNESDIPEEVWAQVNAVSEQLIAGEIETGVDLASGDMLDADMMDDDDMHDDDMDDDDDDDMHDDDDDDDDD